MLFYLAIWIILLISSFTGKNHRLLFWLMVVFLTIVAGARDLNIGTDTLNYSYFFDAIREGSTPSNLELGWVFLNRAVICLGLDYNGCLWVTSAITLGILSLVAVRDSDNPMLVLFVYYSMYAYLNSFNIMRQFLAISIVLLGYHHLYRQKVGPFIVCILIAMTFHFSAGVALLALLVRRVRLSENMVLGSLIVTFFIGALFNYELIAPLLGRYGHYMSDSRYFYREGSVLYPLILSLLMCGLFLYIFLTSPGRIRTGIWMKLFWAAIVMNNLSMKMVLGARVIIFFTISQVILFPLYLYATKERKLNALIVVGYLLVIFVKILLLGNSDETGVIPYRSVISPYMNVPSL